MLDLNLTNIEELVFYDREVQKLLPDTFFSVFEQWRIAKRLPMLSSVGKQAVLDFLNTVTDQEIETLELYFGQKINVEKLNYSVSINIKVPLSKESEICNQLCDINFNYFSTWRDEEYLYISFWR